MAATDDILAKTPLSLGELTEYANSLPEDELYGIAETLSAQLCDGDGDARCLRITVLLNAVLHRIVFERHAVPKRFDVAL
jgi:hypothetical protein